MPETEGDVGEESGQGAGYLKDPGLDCMKTSWEIKREMIQGPTGISPDVLQFIFQQITPTIARTPNNYRAPGCPGAQLEPDLMLAVTLWYLASGSMFTDLQSGFRLCNENFHQLCS